jgi:hypothetical protein
MTGIPEMETGKSTFSELIGFDSAWQVSRRNLPAFWRCFGDSLRQVQHQPEYHNAIRIILPYRHRPLAVPRTQSAHWNVYILVLVSAVVERSALADLLFQNEGWRAVPDVILRCINEVRPQPTLDMLYPLEAGASQEPHLLQAIEYVVSDPAQREDYYQSQVELSGPAMRRLYERRAVGRFIGVEVERSIFHTAEMPQWDVIHISGFTIPQILRCLPAYRHAWNAAAAALGGDSAQTRMKRWTHQRNKEVVWARQQMAVTI